MKSFKQPKEKGEQVPIQGSISKSTIGSKKSSKSPRGQHQKKAGSLTCPRETWHSFALFWGVVIQNCLGFKKVKVWSSGIRFWFN